jgi:tetratricopeptide (TPR) repeat protein
MTRFVLFTFLVTLLRAQTPPPLVPVEKLKVPVSEETPANAEQPQAASINGNALFGAKDKDGVIEQARRASEKSPNDAGLLLNLGRAEDSFLRFQASVGTYTAGIQKFPNDYRFLRYRGQRYISLRKFPEAIADLTKAAKMVRTSFDASYYLGIAYYLNGDHDKSQAELGRCEAQMRKPLDVQEDLLGSRNCESLREDPNFLVPLQYWRFLALRRAGKMDEAKQYLESEVSALLEIKASRAFYDLLLFAKGSREINDMLRGANEGSREYLTRASGAATFLFTEGERAQACNIWSRVAMDTNWDHLGVINAESELYRNSKSACALYGQPAAAPKQ